MCACHAVYGDVVSLLNVELYFVEGDFERLMSAWNMAEVALDPFSISRDVEFESLRAMIRDFRGLFGMS